MTILQPLQDIARDQRIALERTNKHITDVQRIIDNNPLRDCGFCNSSENVKWTIKLTPGETNQHLISITCFNCGIQTIPQNVFQSQPDSYHSAAYDLIEIWNGQVK